MKMLRALFLMIAAATAIGGCDGGSPGVVTPEGASYDGGHTLGGGSRTDSTSITAASDTGMTVTESGGHTFGGGN